MCLDRFKCVLKIVDHEEGEGGGGESGAWKYEAWTGLFKRKGAGTFPV